MRRPRYYVRLLTTFLKRFWWLLAFGVLIGIAVFIVVRFIAPNVNLGKTRRIGLVGRYTPNNLPDEVLNKISQGLTTLNEKGEVGPGLAKAWETPDKGKTWVFYLGENYWQDGEKVLAEDIHYEFSDLTVEIIDDSTISFILDNPFTPFPGVVAKPTFKSGLLGSGEWSVDKIIVSGGNVEQLILVHKTKGEEIYKFYPTEENAKLAFKLGKVDELFDIYEPTPLDTWETNLVTENVQTDQVVTLFFNTKEEALADKSTRQGLIYAIDKAALGKRAITPVARKSWAYNSQVKDYKYDVERAEELLADAKKVLGESRINLVTTPVLLDVAERISDFWEKVGINSTVQVVSGIPTEYQVFLAILDVPKDPDQYSIWHSTQGGNITKYSSPRIDKLLEDGRIELDSAVRRKIYLDFQRFLVEDSPAGFLYHPATYTIERR